MLSAALAVGYAVRVDEYLAALSKFHRDLVELLEIVVPVVIQDDKLVILLELLHQQVVVLDLFNCGRGKRIRRVLLADIFLKERSVDDYFVQTVVRQPAKHVAEMILKISFSKCGICKSISDRHAALVEFADGPLDNIS